MPRRLGVIVNPIAGMGGRVGLKGTDGAATLARARELGATPLASERAARALTRLKRSDVECELLTGRGALGETVARKAGFSPVIVGETGAGDDTTAEDTRALARGLAEQTVDLILFAGGDGTARDIFDVVGDRAPILGVPTGVKMHSAVFAVTPEAAGNLAALYLRGPKNAIRLREAEVMDLDEDVLRDGRRVTPRLYGYASSPYERNMAQNAKSAGSPSDEAALEALASRIAREMEPGRVYVFGCGATTRRIKQKLGFPGALLGVDVVMDRRLIATDVTEERLKRLVSGARATIIASVTGGQGFLFGRGNQQISADVIRMVGRDNIMVVTGQAKLMALDPPCLRVDTGDPAVDGMLSGYVAVHTAPGQTTMMKIAA